MANLSESTTYEAGIYQLEATDPIDAGTAGSGISNLQAKQLANRTNYLKSVSDDLVAKGLRFSGQVAITATTTVLTASAVGKMHEMNVGFVTTPTCTLPSTGVNDGEMIGFTVKIGAGSVPTILPGGSDTIPAFNDSIDLSISDTIVLMRKGTTWIVIAAWLKIDKTQVGAVLMHAKNVAPLGHLECNGAAISRTIYAELFGVIGVTFGVGDGSTTFNLPDLRGEFVRGWDHGRTVDSGRVFGSAQSGTQIRDGLDVLSSSLVTKVQNADATSSAGTVTIPASGSTASKATTWSSVRPRNVALMFVIKY